MRGQAILIRAATAADAPAIQAIYAPYVTDTAVSFEDVAPSVDEMAARIAAAGDNGFAFLVADDGGTVLGYAYAGVHRTRPAYRTSVDVSAYVAPGAHRRGIGRSLYEHLIADLAARRYHAAFAGITLPNQASIGLHEALGFTHVGIYREVGFKLGRWHDVGWWQRVV